MTESTEASLQDEYGSHHICFGCGPSNPKGLQLKSSVRDGVVVAEWTPGEEHLAFPGILNGGIIGTLLDCHSNWAAWWALYQRDGAVEPMTVTASYSVKLLRPTPLETVSLRAVPAEVRERSVRIEAELHAGGELCATCEGTFVRPRASAEGH